VKYIRKFDEELKEKSIEEWCEEINIEGCTINVDNTVDVSGDILLGYKMEKLPIQFNVIDGSFDCDYVYLKTLDGCPKIVKGDFSCRHNELKSLDGGPKEVGHEFDCTQNLLRTLIGGPSIVGAYYLCSINKLISLEGAPSKVSGYLYCEHNPIYEVYKLFYTLERYQASMDYNYLRGKNIIRGRFVKACQDAEIKMPKSIKGYKYIDL
jgi:hypothetical protein